MMHPIDINEELPAPRFFLAFNSIWPIISRIVVRDPPFIGLARA
jgi:hypothetical protein